MKHILKKCHDLIAYNSETILMRSGTILINNAFNNNLIKMSFPYLKQYIIEDWSPNPDNAFCGKSRKFCFANKPLESYANPLLRFQAVSKVSNIYVSQTPKIFFSLP